LVTVDLGDVAAVAGDGSMRLLRDEMPQARRTAIGLSI